MNTIEQHWSGVGRRTMNEEHETTGVGAEAVIAT